MKDILTIEDLLKTRKTFFMLEKGLLVDMARRIKKLEEENEKNKHE